jgi:hypothetical protein
MARSDVKGLLLHEGSPGRGWSSISNVKHEVGRVQERFNTAGASLTVVRPSLPDALTHLRETHMHILHLACHGAQKKDPLTSGFILRDEDLTIQEIMQLDLKHPSLAFLSACQTAKGKRDQPDEGVHLAASMLFCGFKSVIATMWYEMFCHSNSDKLTNRWQGDVGQGWADNRGPRIRCALQRKSIRSQPRAVRTRRRSPTPARADG